VEESAAERPVRLVLARGPVRRLRVTEPGGGATAGAAVWHPSPLPAGLTADDGTIEVPLPSADGAAEPIEVQVDAGSGLTAEIEVRPPRGTEEASLAVELREPPRVAGRALDARERRGVAGAFVWLPGDPGSAARADRSGAFSLPVRRPWRGQVLRAAAPGYVEAASRVPAAGPGRAEETVLLLEPAAVLSGTVVDDADRPIEGAEVRVVETGDQGWRRAGGSLYARTDRAGRFRIDGLAARSPHLAHVARQGYSPAVEDVAPAPERPDGRPALLAELRIVLREGRALRARAVDEAGAPVAGARAVLLPEELARRRWPGLPPGVLSAESAADGRFELREVLPGRASLLLSAPGRAPVERQGVEIPVDVLVTDLGELVLEPEAFVEGRVVEPGGSPVAEASVRASRPSSEIFGEWPSSVETMGSERVTSGSDGSFRIGAIRAGQVVELKAEKEGYVDGSASGVRAPTEEPVDLVLRPAATVAGRVVDSRGRPVPEAEVRTSFRARLPNMGFFGRVMADERGAFVLSGVPPGLVALEAAAAGYQPSPPVTLELEPGERREGVEVVLELGAVVTGRVLSPDGFPLEGAQVAATWDDLQSFSPGRPAVTGPDGRFTLDTLAPGRVVLEASREGYGRGRTELELELGGASVEIELERGATVSGRLLEAEGAPAGNRTLQLLPGGVAFDSRARAKATTASDGTFIFHGVAAGEYRLALTDGYRPVWSAPDPIAVQAGLPREGIEVRLPRLAAISGRLLGLAPDQLSGVVVGAAKFEHMTFEEHRGEVLDDGTYRVPGLTPGRWEVTAANLELGRRGQGWIEIEPGRSEATLDVELQGGHTVSGTVRRAGEPIAGAEVSLSGGTATTDLEGHFRIEGVPTGQQGVLVRDPASGAFVVEQVEIEGDRELLLELEAHRIAGTVYAADGSGPIAGATVQVEREQEDEARFSMPSQTVTGSGGGFLLPGVGAGRWRLVVEKSGYAAHVSAVEVLGGDVETAPVFLEPAGVLELRVRLADGRSPSSLLVVVLGAAGQPLATRYLQAAAPGRFVLDTLPAGPSELQVSAPEAPPLRVRVEAPGSADVVLPEPCTLKVTVPELTGEAIPAAVTVTDPSGAPSSAAFGSNQALMLSGQAELTNLAPGTWTVTVTAADGRIWTATATVSPGGANRLVIE
jgi:protocatechuate 3,4-dioxygenase beta subunit